MVLQGSLALMERNPQLQPVCAPTNRITGSVSHWRTASRGASTSSMFRRFDSKHGWSLMVAT